MFYYYSFSMQIFLCVIFLEINTIGNATRFVIFFRQLELSRGNLDELIKRFLDNYYITDKFLQVRDLSLFIAIIYYIDNSKVHQYKSRSTKYFIYKFNVLDRSLRLSRTSRNKIRIAARAALL